MWDMWAFCSQSQNRQTLKLLSWPPRNMQSYRSRKKKLVIYFCCVYCMRVITLLLRMLYVMYLNMMWACMKCQVSMDEWMYCFFETNWVLKLNIIWTRVCNQMYWCETMTQIEWGSTNARDAKSEPEKNNGWQFVCMHVYRLWPDGWSPLLGPVQQMQRLKSRNKDKNLQQKETDR